MVAASALVPRSPLDNPIWHALSTIHAGFAQGDDFARWYPADVSPLAATRDNSDASLMSLARLLPTGKIAAFFLDASMAFPSGWTVLQEKRLGQMVWTSSASAQQAIAAAAQQEYVIEPLGVAHAREMLALAELTKPGPFGVRTPELGTYLGIRYAGQLVAMAGERLRFPGFTEVSAVCTHPDHRGRGHAACLVSAVVRGICDRGEVPFLHVAAENVSAIRLYEQLGFHTRRKVDLAVVRNDAGGAR
ncbi:MAG TPA: GNAT family N-acetyltransferase [Candidatus Limnocylindrales bacterium]|nr:GNAT family N-acetyltransferase [Candidatus Limnocylindrales bacterium]